jgi:hypothetical protein
VATRLVEIKDFPGMTLEDALKIAVHRLTTQGDRHIEALPTQPQAAVGGVWRLMFRVAN